MIYQAIKKARANNKKILAILIDPDKIVFSELSQLISQIKKSPATHVFVGGSLMQDNNLSEIVIALKKELKLPVILFPGSNSQITKEADAILFLSLVSGRNPDYLIGQHVLAAPQLKKSGLEVIPTAYVLIESGTATSVSYISNTNPIPRDKTDIAVATCLAAEMLGMQLIYLEAGSGAKNHVPLEMITKVVKSVNIPVIVGGGIRSLEMIHSIYEAGATLVVVGTAFENDLHFFN